MFRLLAFIVLFYTCAAYPSGQLAQQQQQQLNAGLRVNGLNGFGVGVVVPNPYLNALVINPYATPVINPYDSPVVSPWSSPVAYPWNNQIVDPWSSPVVNPWGSPVVRPWNYPVVSPRDTPAINDVGVGLGVDPIAPNPLSRNPYAASIYNRPTVGPISPLLARLDGTGTGVGVGNGLGVDGLGVNGAGLGVNPLMY